VREELDELWSRLHASLTLSERAWKYLERGMTRKAVRELILVLRDVIEALEDLIVLLREGK